MVPDDDPPRGEPPAPAADEPVPRIGRGRHPVHLPAREIMSILTLVVALIAVLALRRGCSQGVANLFRAMEPPAGDAGQR